MIKYQRNRGSSARRQCHGVSAYFDFVFWWQGELEQLLDFSLSQRAQCESVQIQLWSWGPWHCQLLLNSNVAQPFLKKTLKSSHWNGLKWAPQSEERETVKSLLATANRGVSLKSYRNISTWYLCCFGDWNDANYVWQLTILSQYSNGSCVWGDVPLAKWLACIPCNPGVWGSKAPPPRALCALPHMLLSQGSFSIKWIGV